MPPTATTLPAATAVPIFCLMESPIAQPSLSVVIPAFDVEGWLGATIESVLIQETQPREIIVVDDGSTDATAAVASGFGDGVRLLSQENRGVAAARNAGAAATMGDILLFLDADDLLLPGTLAAACAAFDSGAATEIYVPNHLKHQGVAVQPAWPEYPSYRTITRRDLAAVIWDEALFSNAFVKRQVWETFPFDESLRAAEDLDFFARLLLAGKSITVAGRPGVSTVIRRPGSLTSQTRLLRSQRRRLFAKLAKSELLPRERARVAWHRVRAAIGEQVARRP